MHLKEETKHGVKKPMKYREASGRPGDRISLGSMVDFAGRPRERGPSIED